MAFADLKNDFVFRRIFAAHPDILRGLLNDLLARTGDQTIEAIEYLPSEQLPLVTGAKLSILDVRCQDRAGMRFIVEMQLIHVAGFINRVIYNGCKAYADQLKARDAYVKLTDVVAISICDFELWPDAEQVNHNLPPIPMLEARPSQADPATTNPAAPSSASRYDGRTTPPSPRTSRTSSSRHTSALATSSRLRPPLEPFPFT